MTTSRYEVRQHPLQNGFTTAIHLADGNQKLLAEVRGEKYAKLMAAAPELLAALQGLLADPYLRDPINNERMAAARAAIAKVQP